MADYNPNIPQSTTNLSTSQGQILNNFQQLDAIFGSNPTANHYAFDDATSANRGLHKRVDFPIPLGSNPTVTGTAGTFFTKDVSGVAQAFFTNSATTQQMTGFSSTLGANGTITFPGGLIMKWGQFSFAPSGTAVNVTYGTPFPNGFFVVMLSDTTADPGQVAGVALGGSTTASQFRAVRTGTASLTYFYVALGN